MAEKTIETQVFSTTVIDIEDVLRREVEEGMSNWGDSNSLIETEEKIFEESKKQLEAYLKRYGAFVDYELGVVEWHKTSEFVITANNARYFDVNNKLEVGLYKENPNGLYQEISKFNQWAELLIVTAIKTAVFYCVAGARGN